MSTVQRVNFEPLSNLLQTQIRDKALADGTLVNPLNAVALVDGEWMTTDSSDKAIRASAIGTPGNPASVMSFPLFAERGRTDVQARAERGVPLIMFGEWEADTRIFDAAATVGSGAPITTQWQPVKVATITIGSRSYCGLVGHGGVADTAPIAGYVSRLPAANGGKLRIHGGKGRL
jgi:hypothetical protein